jgi:uncharacterized integral membrane protein
MKKIGLIVMLMAAVTVFSVQNATPVSLVVLFWNVEVPLTLVIVAGMLIGMLTGGLLTFRPAARAKEKAAEPTAESGERSP